MPDPNTTAPTQAEWDECAQAADEATRVFVASLAQAALNNGKHPGVTIIIGYAALTACAEYIRAVSNPDPKAVTINEITAIAYVRGVIRGLDHPINEDGAPFKEALNG